MYLEHRDESEAAHGFGKAIVCISEAVDASLAVHVKHSCLRWGVLIGRACIKKGITWTSCAVHVHALHLMHFHCMHLSDYEDNFHACMHENFGYICIVIQANSSSSALSPLCPIHKQTFNL